MHHVQESQGQVFTAPEAAISDHQDLTTWARDVEPGLSPQESEPAENSIDGMGAMKFTDEEDWGYFGRFGTGQLS